MLAMPGLLFVWLCLHRNRAPDALQGKQVQGLHLTAVSEGGPPLQMRIERVEPDPQDPDQEVYLYTVAYREAATGRWQNLCLPDREGATQAMALAGRWDERGDFLDDGQLTFACTNGALAKCVRLGYKPWKTVQGRSLRDFHQACTRLIRADYLGDGRSHTREGTLVEVYDVLGMRRPSGGKMVFEAAWSPLGATCIRRTRLGEPVGALVRQCRAGRSCPAAGAATCLNAAQALKDHPESLLFVNSWVTHG
jgi:hypothetical protein